MKTIDYEQGSKYLRVEDAIEIVLELARENIIEETNLDEGLEFEKEKQTVACDVIQDYFVNNVC